MTNCEWLAPLQLRDGDLFLRSDLGLLPEKELLREIIKRAKATLALSEHGREAINLRANIEWRQRMGDSDAADTQIRLAKARRGSCGGHLYVAKNSRNGYYKVGFSKKPSLREKTLQAEEPEISFIFTTPGTMQDEWAIHEHFKDQRVRGEWFSLTNEDIEWIKKGWAA